MNGTVDALESDCDGNLYVGGTFTSAGGNGAAYLAFAATSRRMVLVQHERGRIGQWALSPTGWIWRWAGMALAPGWIARDVEDERVLIQYGDDGVSGLWRLGDDGQPISWSKISDRIAGWNILSLDGDKVVEKKVKLDEAFYLEDRIQVIATSGAAARTDQLDEFFEEALSQYRAKKTKRG